MMKSTFVKIAVLAAMATALSGCIVISTTKSEKPAASHQKPAGQTL